MCGGDSIKENNSYKRNNDDNVFLIASLLTYYKIKPEWTEINYFILIMYKPYCNLISRNTFQVRIIFLTLCKRILNISKEIGMCVQVVLYGSIWIAYLGRGKPHHLKVYWHSFWSIIRYLILYRRPFRPLCSFSTVLSLSLNNVQKSRPQS